MVSEPKDYRRFLAFEDPPFDELLKTVTPIIAKGDTNMRGAVTPSQGLSMTLLCLGSEILLKTRNSCILTPVELFFWGCVYYSADTHSK
jgi:hypothetical protein